MVSNRRYMAAEAAARAGCGAGVDDQPPDAAEKAKWRRQALEWMREELKDLPKNKANHRDSIRAVLRTWQGASEFAGVRDDAIASLPEDEQAGWRQFWADV